MKMFFRIVRIVGCASAYALVIINLIKANNAAASGWGVAFLLWIDVTYLRWNDD